jgi:hypothetical protein
LTKEKWSANGVNPYSGAGKNLSLSPYNDNEFPSPEKINRAGQGIPGKIKPPPALQRAAVR